MHFTKGFERRGGQRVLSALRRGLFTPLYANKEAGFVWYKSKFLSSLTQISMSGFFSKLLGALRHNQQPFNEQGNRHGFITPAPTQCQRHVSAYGDDLKIDCGITIKQ